MIDGDAQCSLTDCCVGIFENTEEAQQLRAAELKEMLGMSQTLEVSW